MLGDAVPGAKPVLDCQHQCSCANDRGDCACGRTDMAGFGGNDAKITGANVGHITRGGNPFNYPVSAGALDAQPF